MEVSKEQSMAKTNTGSEMQEHKTSENYTEESYGYDSDHYSEIDANDHVVKIDTLVDDADIDNNCNKVFTFAPGEGSFLKAYIKIKMQNTYAFHPYFVAMQAPPSKDERLVPVHYSEIVKWELRSVDRRVPNILLILFTFTFQT